MQVQVQMFFRVTARTLVQLGAELISSDSIAFYELIKNAFDAGSPRVLLDVCVRMDHGAYLSHVTALSNQVGESPGSLEKHKLDVVKDIDSSSPEAAVLIDKLKSAQSYAVLLRQLEEANYIQIEDQGHGMSIADLEEIYLTIGTPHRRRQRITQSESVGLATRPHRALRPILGEKGLGRLSAMRLGWRLEVLSSTRGEERENRLQVDWREFRDDNLMVEDISVSLTKGTAKNDPGTSGTRIRIYALTAAWSTQKLERIARDEFSKLTDPFVPDARYPINVRYNDEPVTITRFDDILFEYAHASATAEYTIDDGGPQFVGELSYRTHKRETSFSFDKTQLFSIAELTSLEDLRSLGPFSVQFYWYNRRILSAIEGIGDQRAVRNLVNAWTGGLKVYRDGFRVNPYGSPDDDWLDIDRTALAASAYKVNRRQIIGVVSISSQRNPALMDQTNREGLRDCPEKHILVRLLQHLLVSVFRPFLSAVEREVRATIPATFEDLEERVENEERNIQQNLRTLLDRYPEVQKDEELIRSINVRIRQIRVLLDEASRLAASYRAGQSELTNLAGIGLMLEIVAHELNRATSHTLKILADAKPSEDTEVVSLLRTLGAQMKTLQKRLRILDPLSTAGRQRKERFDLVSWLRFIFEAHTAQFARHGVTLTFEVVPSSSSPRLTVYMVKGMFVQILENLLANSMYWLKIERRLNSMFEPRIGITLDKNARVLIFSDNGPGIPVDRREQVFQPFFTTKPPGEGHGLGLYVSQEIARYNGAKLDLVDTETGQAGRLNTFRLQLEAE